MEFSLDRCSDNIPPVYAYQPFSNIHSAHTHTQTLTSLHQLVVTK